LTVNVPPECGSAELPTVAVWRKPLISNCVLVGSHAGKAAGTAAGALTDAIANAIFTLESTSVAATKIIMEGRAIERVKFLKNCFNIFYPFVCL
jgi:hypothetical protein